MTVEGARRSIAAAELEAFCARLLMAQGVSAEDAATTSAVFCQAEMMGEESHGLRLFVTLLGRIEAGGDRARTEVTVLAERGAIAVWDANRSLGQVVAARAMALAIEKARAHGIGLVAVRNGNSLTSAKYYALMAAEAGMIGLVYTNASRKVMPPPGGRTPVMGNNPMAFAAPAGRHGAFVLDMACTAAAIERIIRAKEQGEEIPKGWALDETGSETTDPARALDAMTLLPFGGYKAFGLASVHEIMTSVLAGGEILAGVSTGFFPLHGPMNTSFSLLAIDIGAFQPVEAFEERMDALISTIKGAEPVGGAGEILFPGERSQRRRAESLQGGVRVAEATMAKLDDWARRLGEPSLK